MELSPKLSTQLEPSLDFTAQKINVLVADDSEDNLFLIRRMLTKMGLTVSTASNGIIACRMALEGNFDLVLMDIQMPEMDGYEATKALRQQGYSKPIIALTAHAMSQERELTAAAGCDAHLTKPINRNELAVIINSLTRYTK
ncbi:MAG: response regulator [Proteobacteria bacterium]|nr:MAG: response regulator [Pseudomonadota bacterium]